MAKFRNSFVTNSSSSSFVISKRYISEYQKELIMNYEEEAKKFGMDWAEGWDITEEDKWIEFYTFMDNFDMSEFLGRIGVDISKIKWGNW